MRTIVKLIRGARETIYQEVDLPYMPEGTRMAVPDSSLCRVVYSCVDITHASGPVQHLAVAQ
jgi:hypothetical protein